MIIFLFFPNIRIYLGITIDYFSSFGFFDNFSVFIGRFFVRYFFLINFNASPVTKYLLISFNFDSSNNSNASSSSHYLITSSAVLTLDKKYGIWTPLSFLNVNLDFVNGVSHIF